MTTVAYDGKLLVSDSSMRIKHAIQPAPFRKIYTPEEGEYWEVQGIRALAFGYDGHSEGVEVLKDKLRENLTRNSTVGDVNPLSFSALIIDENGLAHYWQCEKDGKQETYSLLPMLPPVTIGTGDNYALAVMSIGKSAKVAIKAAIRLDIDSNGALQVFEFPGRPEKPSKRPEITAPTLPEAVTERETQ
jgi:hypothetical protein